MAKQEMYRQCTVEKPTETGRQRWTFWAPENKAVVGNTVKVEETNGTWSEGWTVVEAYNAVLPEKVVQHRSHDHTRQRQASDI